MKKLITSAAVVLGLAVAGNKGLSHWKKSGRIGSGKLPPPLVI